MESQTPYTRHQSTPWSETPIPTPSEPSTTPYPRYQSTPWPETPIPTTQTWVIPSQELSQQPLQQQGSDNKTNRAFWRSFWRDESNRTLVLRLCLSKQEIFSHSSISLTAFWKTIGEEFKASSGITPPQTLSRTITTWVKERRDWLELHDSGEQDNKSSYEDALDDWIIVLNTKEASKQELRELQGQKDKDTQDSLAWRERQFQVFSRKRECSTQDDEDTSDQELEYDTPQESVERDSQATRTSSTQSRTTHRKKKKTRRDSPDPFARSLNRLVDHVVAQGTQPSTSEGRVESRIQKLETDIQELKGGINQILSLLGNRT
jgi:hypothetical protein